MGTKQFRLRRILFLISAYILLLTGSLSAEPLPKKNILILNSYHQGYKWTDEETQGVLSQLTSVRNGSKLYIEYMGTKWVADDKYFDQFRELFKLRYKKIPLDLIIATDNDAYNFLRKYRDELFGNVPVVFCGVNWFNPEDIAGKENYTGVNEDADIEDNLDLMLQLHPKVKQVYVVSDLTTTGLIVHEKFNKIIPRYKGRLDFRWLDDIDMPQLLANVAQLPNDSIVFITIFQKDKAGKFFEFNEIAEMVSQVSRVPVYGLWDFHLGYGIVGGVLTSGQAQGEAAGRLALRVLQGEVAGIIPVIMRSPNRLMFDYRQLERFGISRSSLPRGSVLINVPVSFYAVNKRLVWGVSIGLLILVVLVVILLLNIRLRKRVEKELRQIQSQLEDRVKERTAALSQSNKEFQEASRKLEDIIDFLPDATFVVDVNGICVGWNKATEKMTGVPASQMLGRGNYEYALPFYGVRRPVMIDFVRGIRDDRLVCAYGAGTDRKDVMTAEVFLADVNGKALYVWAKATCLYDRAGQLVGAIETVRDITEKKQAEKELQSAQERLLQSEKMASIGQLAAGVAHEINNPTAFLVSNMDTLKHYEMVLVELFGMYNLLLSRIPIPSSDELAGLVQKIETFKQANAIDHVLKDLPVLVNETCDGALRIKKIVMDLRTFAHSDCGEKQPADINTLIDVAVNIAWNEFKYNVEVVKEYGNIPSLDCYSQSLSQAFLNLLVNAAQAIEKKGTVTVRTRLEGETISVDIIDTGCGMSEDVQRHLFEPFFTTKPVGKGTGLGLSLVYNIVKRHGGTISVASQVGRGSAFTVRLPLKDAL